ncbi:hypothetical protein [Streptomyces europaeiscabiei]|uniref:hypothetical protein n=1 Tax=Streptomyces europaeiscabiei TaxID=146819 RepID=UPI0029B5178D|nr:hypothetical protein [Streptomyces europaeiscabiei]MDX3584348.1 hypothetical protein [Streptomyces europaeiscabiei]MDX3615785.1 hypothetical protein [Streptomyces europaeiscabiei]
MSSKQTRSTRRRLVSTFIGAITVSVLATAPPAQAIIVPPDKPQVEPVDTVGKQVERATGVSNLLKAELDDVDSVAVSDSSAGVIEVPRNSTAPVTLKENNTGTTLGVSLPGSGLGTAQQTDSGTIYYDATAATSATAVQLTSDGSVRALVDIKKSTAPSEYRFDLDLPAGASLVENTENNTIEVVQEMDAADVPGELLEQNAGDEETEPGTVDFDGDGDGRINVVMGQVEAPWAKDALGNPVPTEYRIEGDTIVQSVAFTGDTTFPVVADPKISYGRYVYVRFGRSEVKAVDSKGGILGVTAAMTFMCNRIPVPWIRVGCMAGVVAVGSKIRKTFALAENEKKCVEIKTDWDGFIAGWRRYSC